MSSLPVAGLLMWLSSPAWRQRAVMCSVVSNAPRISFAPIVALPRLRALTSALANSFSTGRILVAVAMAISLIWL